MVSYKALNTIRKGVKVIGNSAFMYCKSLTNINIPNSVTNIGDRAFEGCKNLPSKIKSDIIKRFGEKVFESWSFLIPSAGSAKEH